MGFCDLPVPCVILVALLSLHAAASSSSGAPEEAKKLYIVYLGERQHEDADLVTASHRSMLASILGSKEEALESIVYSYRHGFSGFSAMLTESHARKIAALPGVLSVTKNQIYHTQTTRSWDFLGLDYNQPNGLLAKAKYGDGIIIGVIDTGIWPESPSFADDGYGPPPTKWKGICQTGESFGPDNCNGKIIGARWYAKDVEDPSVLVGEFLSPRDMSGHGTHVASTAAGNVVRNVSFHGLAPGVARGGAPRARIAVYKVCWGMAGQCSGAAVMKAVDDAVHDGVDVLSVSIAGAEEYVASLHAVVKGIPVVYAAGNFGPIAQTVVNSSPWLLTVAATTMDRSFPTVITLGNNQKFVGQSLFAATEEADQFYKLLFMADLCDPTYLNSTKKDIKGVVIVCLTFSSSPLSPNYVVLASIVAAKGGKGLIFARYNTDTLTIWEYLSMIIPTVAVDFEIAYKIIEYSSTGNNPKVKISLTQTTIGTQVPAPKVATFSSRGPSPIFPGVLKPDIAAPGTTILAAAPQTDLFKNTLAVSYFFDSGTSMACPHVSGIVAILKSLHPNWSPAALKSAIMTTAYVTDNNGFPLLANGHETKVADPFDYGAGFVNPGKVDDPGLIYDIKSSDYLNFFHCMGGLGTNDSCTTTSSLANLNLPSITIPNLKTSITVVRTVTNVGHPDAVYKVLFQPPIGVQMYVKPSILMFDKAKTTQTFKVTFMSKHKVQGDYTFGNLVWHDGGSHWVQIPIAVRVIIEELYSNNS